MVRNTQDSPGDAMVGTTLSHYRILAKLGAGGMGEVFRAHDERLGRDVALKVLPAGFACDPERRARFEREARAAAALDHPGILAVHELGCHDDRLFLVTELLEGETLRDRLAGGRLPVSVAVAIAAQVAEALAAAHARGVVHRDLKPENLFLAGEGRVKILDFGLARLFQHAGNGTNGSEIPTGSLATREGTVLGTVGYMAPEQVRGHEADARTDLFALGCVLYEMLTGHRAFTGDTPADVVSAVLTRDPSEVPASRSGVPPSLVGVVRRCLAKRPGDRFDSAHDLVLALEAATSDAAAAMRPPARIRQWSAAGAAVAVAAVIAAWLLVPQTSDTPESPPATPRIVVLPFENLGPAEHVYFADGVTEEITSRLAAVSGLRVISRTSAEHYRGHDADLRTIAAELGVDYVLEGSVRWAPGGGSQGRVRVTPQLIRVSDDSHMWADSFDRVVDDIFAIQSEIARAVVNHLGVALAPREQAAVAARPTDNLEAYHAFLLGRHLARQPHFTLALWEEAIASFTRAVELDPGFTLAWAELARAHARLRFFGHDLSAARLAAARRAGERAMASGPASPEVHVALAYYHLWADRDAAAALDELAAAEAQQPPTAESLQARYAVLEVQGDWEQAASVLERATALSPRDGSITMDLAITQWVRRDYEAATAACDRTLELAPENMWPYIGKAFVSWSWGRFADGRRALEAMPPIDDDWVRFCWYWQEMFEGRYRDAVTRLSAPADGWIRTKMWVAPNTLWAAWAYQAAGDTDRAREAFAAAVLQLEEEVRSQPPNAHTFGSLGLAYAALGRREEALAAGRRGVELLSTSRDGFYGLGPLHDLVLIHATLGDTDAAVAGLENLLTRPSWITPAWIDADPRWRPIRDEPAFRRLLAPYR